MQLGVGSHVLLENLTRLSCALTGNFAQTVECIYNLSTQFAIADKSDPNIFPVVGNLPNSGESEELSEHIGHRSNPIVAIDFITNDAFAERTFDIAARRKLCRLECYPAPASVSPLKSSMSLSVSQILPPMPPVFQWGGLRCKHNPYSHTDSVI